MFDKDDSAGALMPDLTITRYDMTSHDLPHYISTMLPFFCPT